MSEIYEPSEDSEFLVYFLKNFFSNEKFDKKNFKYLDMGTGSGILSECVSKFIDKRNILAVDINSDAVEYVRKKGFEAINSNLFSKLGKEKFDLITFNAPYLPRNKFEPKDSQLATTGGRRGDEISVRFLKQARKYLNEKGKILLLVSSLTPLDRLKEFGGKIVARKKLFFEELLILEF